MSMPVLPTLPSGVDPAGLTVEIARLDRSGRVSARRLLRVLGWDAGHRVAIGVPGGVLVVGSSPTGLHAVGAR